MGMRNQGEHEERPNWPQESINNRQRGAQWWTLKVYFQLWHHMLVVIHNRKWGQACHHSKWPTRNRIWDQVLCHAFNDQHSTYIATMSISRQPAKNLVPNSITSTSSSSSFPFHWNSLWVHVWSCYQVLISPLGVGIKMKLRQLIIGEFDGAILNAVESRQPSWNPILTYWCKINVISFNYLIILNLFA